jgi:hypothetical protein
MQLIENGIKIKTGIIDINCARYLAKHDDVVVLIIDCVQKYPKISAYYEHSVVLTASRGLTLSPQNDIDFDKSDTEITIDGLSKEEDSIWLVYAEAARYTILITFVKQRVG